MKRNHCASFFACVILALSVGASAFGASEGHYYGVVESFDNGQLVVRTTKHSTGNWIVDASTKVEGSIVKYDWVLVELGRGGHAAVLRFEERPTGHSGVVKGVRDHVLTVHSGSKMENWNVTDATLGDGATRVEVGDEISVKVYRNHNLAELSILRHGVR